VSILDGRMFAFLIRVVFLVLMISAANAAERTALVVGNSAYPFGALANPANDAKLIAETLKKTGFDVTVVLDANKVTLQTALLAFSRDIRTKDTVGLFYYAGHGAQVNGANYLIPIDADITSESEVKIFGINVDEFVATLERADGRTNIVILDSCRNNPFTASSRSATRGMALPDAPAGTFVALSTSPGGVALDGEGANSPYAEALAQSMLEPNVSIEQAFKVTRRLVLENTKQKQVPWETSSLTGDFYFLPKKETAEPVVEATAPAEPVVAPEPKTEEAPQVAVAEPERQVEAEPTTEVTATNLAEVEYENGSIRKTDDTHWQEFNAEGKATFSFEEQNRDDGAVYLNDASRNLQLKLDVSRKMVSVGENGGDMRDLYPITKVLAMADPAAAPAVTENDGYAKPDIQPQVFPLGKWAEGLAIANNAIYVAESGSRRIVKIDPGGGDLLDAITVGRLPVSMAADSDGNVYAAAFTDGKIFRQPPEGKGKVIASFKRPSFIRGMGVGDNALYIATSTEENQRTTTISRIDAHSGVTVASVPFNFDTNRIAVQGDRVWLLDTQNQVYMLDGTTLQVLDSVRDDGFVWSMATNKDAVFAAGRTEQQSGNSIIYRHSKDNPNERISQVLEGQELIVAIAANDNRVAALGNEGAIWILDATTLKPLKWLDSNREPHAAVFENGHLFITTFASTSSAETSELLIYNDVGHID
jgi:Caspase domain